LLLGTHHGLSRPYAIQEYKFICLYLPAGTTGEEPPQLSTFTEEEQQMKNIEKLTIQLHNITLERNELRGILANYNKDLNNRLNFELEMLKKEHQQVMSDLQKLPMEMIEALDKCKHLMEANECYRYVPELAWEGMILPSLSLT
ncbi:hypothetical protein A6R68_03302, partial [Neotoma lepida]